MRKFISVLLILLFCFTGCSKETVETEQFEEVSETVELTYFEKRLLNDTNILLYDMKTNEGHGGYAGDVVWTLDIVDPTYYGKVPIDMLSQVQNMYNQLLLENQVNKTDELYDNINLFCSTDYTEVEGRNWVFLMQNYDSEGVHNNSIMGVTEYNNKWVVFNLMSSYDDTSPYKEIDEGVYADFYKAYNLNTTKLTENLLHN